MQSDGIYIELAFIRGLLPIVRKEAHRRGLQLCYEEGERAFLIFSEKNLREAKQMRSVKRVSLLKSGALLNPGYIFRHKFVLGELIDIVTKTDTFHSWKLHCAGNDSLEARRIASYVEETFALQADDPADLKVHIVKPNRWEVKVEATPRPLSQRKYRTTHLPGAADPTIAFALQSVVDIDPQFRVINPFSGSGTILIETALAHPTIQEILGFDNDKKNLSLSIQNIKKAGLIKRVSVHEADIIERPQYGECDLILSDLPFGMSMGKGKDIAELYRTFFTWCDVSLSMHGSVVVYTAKTEELVREAEASRFSITDRFNLRLMSNVGAYLYPSIFVLARK